MSADNTKKSTQQGLARLKETLPSCPLIDNKQITTIND